MLVVRRAVSHIRGGLFDHILKIQCFRYKDSRTFGSDVVLISPPVVNARGVYPRHLSKRGGRSEHDWLKSDLVFSQMVETIFTKGQSLKLPRRHRILSPDYVPAPVHDENLWLGQEARDWNDVLIAPVKDGPAVCVVSMPHRFIGGSALLVSPSCRQSTAAFPRTVRTRRRSRLGQ